MGRAGDRARWPLAPSLEDWKVEHHWTEGENSRSGKTPAPIRVLQRKRTSRRWPGTDRIITPNLLRVTEAGKSTSALQTGKERPGKAKSAFPGQRQSAREFFFIWLRHASLPGLSWPSSDWARPTHTVQGNLLYSEPTNLNDGIPRWLRW